MSKHNEPWSAARARQWEAQQAERRAMTDRAILAGIEAVKAGGDPAVAIAAVTKPRGKPGGDDPDMAPIAARLRQRRRIDGWSIATQRQFIQALADSGCVSHACAAVGVARNTAYAMRQRESYSLFALAWDVAIQMGRKRLLDIAMERAIAGQEVAVWHRGEQVGTRTVYNDRLLTFLLAHQPAPAHPVLTPPELAALFPALLDVIDQRQPHPAAARLEAEDAEAGAW
ncbi:hypothetical protein [Sphingomonas sp. RIT328]|uniref:hypothetical protein n=1 Tax=Sphingomonas sp. RIT328 TaxID=1470591 RepID=UPI000447EE67|nr:hypothetical protein [Sphingomonas sp. RIT328]EZP55506.1 hypothetical protein BW41_00958 [Sphingomonas sp. RIT328]